MLSPATDRSRFGFALAAADFDGDALSDLAIGAPGKTIDGQSLAGEVIFVYGSGGGLFSERAEGFTLNSPGVVGSAHDHDHFGEALSAGDFDGDGHFDRLAGAEGWNNLSGAVFVLYGSADGISGSGSQGFQPSSDAPNALVREGDRLGEAVTTGDCDGDGYWDLIAGLPGKDPSGAMLIIPESKQGLDADRFQLPIALKIGFDSPSSQFGLAVR